MKKLIILFYCLFSLSPSGQAKAEAPASVQVYLFYAEDCQSCGGILHGYLPALKSTYPFLEVKTFDIGNPSNYEALVRLEKQFGRTGNELPVIAIGGRILSGEKEIMERLDSLILEQQMAGGSSLPLPAVEAPSTAKPSEKSYSVDLAFFYQTGCPKCDRANFTLKYLKKNYPRLNVKEIDLNTADGKRLNESLSARLNLPAEKRLIAPSIFVGSDYLSPEEITESNIEGLIQKYEKVGPLQP